MKEYVITFKSSIQIGPDDWAVINPSMKANSDTKLSDIEAFYRNHISVAVTEVSVRELI